MMMKSLVPVTAIAAVLMAAGQAAATAYTTTNPTTFLTLGNNAATGSVADQVNWGAFDMSLGHSTFDDQTIQNNAMMTTALSENVTVQSGDGGSFTTFVEGQSNWQGDFGPGITVLYSTANSITLKFATALIGLGVDGQILDTGPFGISLSAYDAAGDLLTTATNSATSTGTGPDGVGGTGPGGTANEGSAPFVGVATDATPTNVATNGISFVTISVTGDNGDGFAIDTSLLYHYPIQEPEQTAQTPEPGTLGLLGVGLAGLGAFRRRRRG